MINALSFTLARTDLFAHYRCRSNLACSVPSDPLCLFFPATSVSRSQGPFFEFPSLLRQCLHCHTSLIGLAKE